MLDDMATSTALPESFAAGTTVKYTRTLTDYPANGGWTLTLYLAGATVLSVAATPSGADHAVTLTPAQTATLATAGVYRWTERVNNATEKYDVASGTVYVTQNIATAAAGDLQTFEEKALAIVEAALLANVGSDIVTYQIHGRAVTRETRLEALAYRNKLRWDVARQRNKGKAGRTRRVSFTGAENES